MITVYLFLVAFYVLAFSTEGISQTRIGKTRAEIEKLAVKEGGVSIAGSVGRDKWLFEGFSKKFPTIKVEATYTSGAGVQERVLSEALAGVVQFDVFDVGAPMQENFMKAGVIAGPIEWRKLFPDVPEVHFSPGGHFVAAGFNLRVFAYNPSLVPRARVPKDWVDCLDPYWRGKVAVDSQPKPLSGLYKAWGEKRILKFAADLKNNQPIWVRDQTKAMTQLAVGEFAMICGANYASLQTLLRRDPKANAALALPREVPVPLGETLAVLKGSRSPNAAVLLAGWLASAEGQKALDRTGRGSPFIEGGEKSKLIKESGATPIFEGWDRAEYEPMLLDKIIATWGLPVAK